MVDRALGEGDAGGGVSAVFLPPSHSRRRRWGPVDQTDPASRPRLRPTTRKPPRGLPLPCWRRPHRRGARHKRRGQGPAWRSTLALQRAGRRSQRGLAPSSRAAGRRRAASLVPQGPWRRPPPWAGGAARFWGRIRMTGGLCGTREAAGDGRAGAASRLAANGRRPCGRAGVTRASPSTRSVPSGLNSAALRWSTSPSVCVSTATALWQLPPSAASSARSALSAALAGAWSIARKWAWLPHHRRGIRWRWLPWQGRGAHCQVERRADMGLPQPVQPARAKGWRQPLGPAGKPGWRHCRECRPRGNRGGGGAIARPGARDADARAGRQRRGWPRRPARRPHPSRSTAARAISGRGAGVSTSLRRMDREVDFARIEQPVVELLGPQRLAADLGQAGGPGNGRRWR